MGGICGVWCPRRADGKAEQRGANEPIANGVAEVHEGSLVRYGIALRIADLDSIDMPGCEDQRFDHPFGEVNAFFKAAVPRSCESFAERCVGRNLIEAMKCAGYQLQLDRHPGDYQAGGVCDVFRGEQVDGAYADKGRRQPGERGGTSRY